MAELLKSREFNLAVMIIFFCLTFFPYFLSIPGYDVEKNISSKVQLIVGLITPFTVILAIYSQYRRGFNAFNKRQRGWWLKVYMLFCIASMLIFYVVWGKLSGPYYWVTLAVISPLSTINYGVIFFYMASTTARAFKARNLKALLLLVAGFIVFMDQAPLTGLYTTIFNPVAVFLNDTLVGSVTRTFTICSTIGGLVYGVRVLLGLETGAMGVAEKKEA